MGDVYWGLHLPLAAGIRRAGIRSAIETGTYFGGGAAHLASMFEHVVTIERDARYRDFCVETFKGVLHNVSFECGESSSLLPVAYERVGPGVLFVLDAHWFPALGEPPGDAPNCPIGDELAAIGSIRGIPGDGSVVLIDDADMFLRSLPDAFRDQDFPTIFEIYQRLREMGFEYISVCDDVILAGPGWLAQIEQHYLSGRDYGRPGAKQF